jgi:hypothetical protein
MTVRSGPEKRPAGGPGRVSVRDGIAITCAAVAGGSLLIEITLALVQAPTAAISATGGIGVAAISAIGVYFGRRTA